MNIILLTQNDPFYLGKNIDYLLEKLPGHSQVVGCVVFDASPFGKRESFLDKAKKTFDIFGAVFFTRYAMQFVLSKLSSKWQVKRVLQRHDVPLIEIQGSINSNESLAKIASYKPDLIVSIAGNQVFKRPLIDLAPKGCINLHTALLPKYRGLMPSFWVLKNGEKETGVSVFLVDEDIDSGPILVQNRVEIGDRSQEELIKHTKKLGMDAIVEAIELIHRGGYNLIENNAADMTYFSFPTREDVKIFRARGKRFF
jgi:methionyl-tRNA formyltransferase